MLALQQLCECCASWVLFSALFVCSTRAYSFSLPPLIHHHAEACAAALWLQMRRIHYSSSFSPDGREEGEMVGGWLVEEEETGEGEEAGFLSPSRHVPKAREKDDEDDAQGREL